MPGIKEWLKKASSDLKASKKLSDDDETLDCAVFHTHQCAEKAFKAFIVFAQQPIPKTHDLRFLFECCLEINSELLFLKEESRGLNAYGQDSRYPNDSFYVDKQLTDKAIITAEEILLAITKRVTRNTVDR